MEFEEEIKKIILEVAVSTGNVSGRNEQISIYHPYVSIDCISKSAVDITSESVTIPRIENSILRSFMIMLFQNGAYRTIKSMLRSLIDIDNECNAVKEANLVAYRRLEYLNRIESNVIRHPSVNEAWKEFRLYYKLSTGEDLPPLGNK